MKNAYGDKNLFYKFFWFIIEKFDLRFEMSPEKEVSWIYSFVQEWKILILPFSNTLKI